MQLQLSSCITHTFWYVTSCYQSKLTKTKDSCHVLAIAYIYLLRNEPTILHLHAASRSTQARLAQALRTSSITRRMARCMTSVRGALSLWWSHIAERSRHSPADRQKLSQVKPTAIALGSTTPGHKRTAHLGWAPVHRRRSAAGCLREQGTGQRSLIMCLTTIGTYVQRL